MFVCGYIIQRRKQVKVDYSKWLGPDYKYTYDGAGIYIVNHTNPLDTPLFCFLMNPYVSFLGKREVKNIPIVGFMCDPLM
jgi:1-acyl-sn-glycerol-3-phosphate acyltransferase